MAEERVTPESWEEFRASGLLWWINRTLHLFGWAIVLEVEDGTGGVVDAYPARITFRGFDNETSTEQFTVLTKYIAEHARELVADVTTATVRFSCPYHQREGEVRLDKNPKLILHDCGCYLLVSKVGDKVKAELRPDNP